MESSKITLEIREDLLRQGNQYARNHGTSLSKLIEEFITSKIKYLDHPEGPFLPQADLDKAFYAKNYQGHGDRMSRDREAYHEYILNRVPYDKEEE